MMIESSRQALVVEDNAALRRVVGRALQSSGFEVTTAEDGQVGWEAAKAVPFDLVVTDQQMPHLGGLELIELLRGSSDYSSTPIVLLTAKGLELDNERLRAEYGVSAVLNKPFSPSALGALAESLVAEPA